MPLSSCRLFLAPLAALLLSGAACSSATHNNHHATGGKGGTGGASSCPKQRTPPCNSVGGACTPTSIGAADVVRDLAISGDYLFFSTEQGNRVHRMRYDGSEALDIQADGPTFELAVAADRVYWTDYFGGGYVKGAAFDGTGLTSVAQMPGQIRYGKVAVDVAGTTVYWVSEDPPGIWRATADGLQPAPTHLLTGTFVSSIAGLALDDAYLYFGDPNGVERIKTSDLGTDPPPVETFAQDLTTVGSVVLDADRVYWFNQANQVLSKGKVDSPGDAARVHSAGGSDARLGIAVDDTDVYWLSSSGAVNKGVKTGGPATVVANGPTLSSIEPLGLVVDCGAVYWATGGPGGSLLRAAKGIEQ